MWSATNRYGRISGLVVHRADQHQVKLHMIGVSTPHTGTEIWLQWLSDPRYMTYITPGAETADPDAGDMVDLTCSMDGISFKDIAEVSGQDAVDTVQTGPSGTYSVPQTTPAPPVGYAGPQTEAETASISQALSGAKGLIQAYSANPPPIPDLDDDSEPALDPEQQSISETGIYVTDVDRTYQKLASISLYVGTCTARLVTYNVMARLAAALATQATADYNEAVSMGRKEIREILRMAPHFFRLMEESGLTGSNSFLSSSISRDYESSSSSDNSDSSLRSGGDYLVSRTHKSLPNLAKSYIGLMILWPVATAASTDLIDEDQFKYIMGMLDYIIKVCGIRMGQGVRQFCIEKRQLSGAPFFT